MFNRPTVAIIAVIAFVIGAVVGVLGYNAITAGSGEASISASDAAATVAASRPTLAATIAATTIPATSVPATKAATSAPTVESQSVSAATVEATTAVEATTEVTDAPAVAASSSPVTYSIDATQSEARFTLQEDLRGEHIDVVGTTKDVGGDIMVDMANPQNSSINPIVINARTLTTPETMRNQAIRSRILRSAEDAYEFITFTPTSITGLPTKALKDGPVTFQVTGDLKIIEITKSVTFDITIDKISDTAISGTGKTVINWADFNLSIPNAPGVANVTPEVTLEINFVANAAK